MTHLLSLFDALAEEPVSKRPLLAYAFVSACLWVGAGLAHHEHGIAALVYAPAFAVPLIVAGHVVAALLRELLVTTPYFVALAGVLLVVSRLTPGRPVSFRQFFSLTVHAGYILLAGHALRIALAAGGVEPSGAMATLLPDPGAMFSPEADATTIAFAVFPDSPADVLSAGVFDTAFHALLGLAYCRIRGTKRLMVGAAWGTGLSLLADVLWLLLRIGG